jgi:hypothetical protein
MSNVIFSVEKGFRFFQEGISFFHFFMVQFGVPKELIGNKAYYFSLVDENNNEIYSKDIYIDLYKFRIVTPNSHEDPLVEDDNNYHICFQIDSELLCSLNKPCNVLFYEKNNGNLKLISSSYVGKLSDIYNRYKTEHYSEIINKHQLISKKDCPLTLHLGDSNGNYSEQYYNIKAGEVFDFKKYINDFEYIGVQCSYEHEIPEIEEKHIIVGQKGIYLSGYFYENESDLSSKIMPPLPFIENYQKKYEKLDFTKVDSINELIGYYKNKMINPKYFESNLNFLLPTYLKESTYNQDKVYSDKKIEKKNHFLLDVCQGCPLNSRCIQVVPSGLSSELFKKNMLIEDYSECDIYSLIK